MVTWSVPIFIQRVQMNEAKLRKICTKAKCNLQDLGVGAVQWACTRFMTPSPENGQNFFW